MFKSVKILIFVLSAFSGLSSFASSIFFPDISPQIRKEEAPEWLKDGREGDGYITISSQIIAENTCTTLSDHGFWGSEKTQLVVSVTTSGFKSKLNKTEIPIATFDGRENGSECASLSSTPIQVVPITQIGSISNLNPGNLSIVLNVKTSNDANHDFVGSAKLLLGAAAMVASGGSASAIGGVTATVGGSVASETQTRANNLLKGMVDAKVPLSLTWTDIRSRIKTIDVGVYRSDKSMGDVTDKRIQQLQNNPKAEKIKLFTVRFNFNYTRTLFNPDITNIDHLNLREDLSSVRVLNYQIQGANQNILQILNNSSPSLLQSIARANAQGLTNACALGFEKLKKYDISDLDAAIIMKTFIDEAKGDSLWYTNPTNVRYCFEQTPTIQNFLERVYGVPEPQFIVGDVQNGTGQAYEKWRTVAGPLLSNLRKALIAKGDRKEVLKKFNNDKDILVTFSPEIAPWVVPNSEEAALIDTTLQAAQSQQSQQSAQLDHTYPGISLLAAKKIKTMGCYIYKDNANLDPLTYGAYFVLKTDDNERFVVKSQFLVGEKISIQSLNFSEFSVDWAQHFSSYSYPGGECKSIIHP
jgi:hypothetical protein